LKAYRNQDYKKALAVLSRLPEPGRSAPRVLFLKGLASYKNSDFESAVRAFARIPVGHRLGMAALYNRAAGWLAGRRPGRALELARKLALAKSRLPVSSHGVAAAALFNISIAFWANRREAEAIHVLRLIAVRFRGTRAHRLALKLLKQSGQRPVEVTIRRCAHFYKKENYSRAVKCFLALLKKRGPDVQILYALGYARYQLKRYRKALNAFDQALLLNPFDGDLVFMKAMACMRLGQYRRAVTFFEKALKLGLSEESPSEARRYLKILRVHLRRRMTTGWHFSVQAKGGYDSHPRLSGSAAAAGTSQWSSKEGSGFIEVELSAGYAFGRANPFRADVEYQISQLVIFSDFASQVQRHGARAQDDESGLSYQSHILATRFLLRFSRLDLRLNLGGFVELAGLRAITPVDGGGIVRPGLDFRWNTFTASEIRLQWTGQKAFTDDFSYLTGHGVSFGAAERFWWKKIIRVVPGYTFSYWWLGTAVTETSDCVGGEPCALSVPYSFAWHKAEVSFESVPVRWLYLEASAALWYRRFSQSGLYRMAAGGDVVKRRKDLTQVYRAVVGFKVFKGARLDLRYRAAHNRSTINADTVGIEEGYTRHVIEIRFKYDS
jgi:tetratricopeptide (TPR) repeat protein